MKTNTRVKRRDSGDAIQALATNDRFGRTSIAGAAAALTDRRTRSWASGKLAFRHRDVNGVYDPYTFFHLTHALASIKPDREFTAGELVSYLNQNVTEICWDAVSVGRIMHDLHDSWRGANNNPNAMPITATRTWRGTIYEVSSHPVARAALFNLIDDLYQLGRTVRATELGGQTVKRLASPLESCPSVMDLLAMTG